MDLLGTWGKRTQDWRRNLLGDDLPPDAKRAATVGTMGPGIASQMQGLDTAQRAAVKRGGVRDLLGDPEVQARATDVASNLDFTGTFGGVFAKGADLGAHNLARRMKGEGKDPGEIWEQTGWFQGPDKKWRFEISDDAARIPVDRKLDLLAPGESYAASEVLKHPDLYAAYPELAGTRVDTTVPGGARGVSRGGAVGIKGDMMRTEQRDTMLHELQHEIQNTEGFAKGGSPAGEATWIEAAKRAREALSFRREMANFPKEWDRSARENAVIEQYRQMNAMDWLPGREARDLAHQPHISDKQLEKLASTFGDEINPDPYKAYRRLAGEAEARLVEKRRSLTPEERRAIFPSYDVPPEQQIVRGVR